MIESVMFAREGEAIRGGMVRVLPLPSVALLPKSTSDAETP
jgi:hypothetical protein